MKCMNCHKGEYKTAKIVKEITINDEVFSIPDVECVKCNVCGDIIYSQQQRLELEKIRLSIESKTKPILTPEQLKVLRKVLDMSLDEISDMLHIGKNTYGRWERGEVEITPSMNLLVHSLIDRVPDAKINIFEKDLVREIEKAKKDFLKDTVSLGEFIRNVIRSSKILPDVVSGKIGVNSTTLTQLENNEIKPEDIPVQISVNIVQFFNIQLDNYRHLLENSLRVNIMRPRITSFNARTASHGQEALLSKTSSLNKILEKYCQTENANCGKATVNNEYLAQVAKLLNDTNKSKVGIK